MIIHLLKEWGNGESTFAAGKFVEVADEIAKELLTDGIAEQKTPDEALAEEKDRKRKEAARKRAEEKEKLSQAAKIVVGDEPEDPRGGFKGFGHFATDVYRAGRNGENTSEPLRKWQQKVVKTVGSDEMRGDVSALGGFLLPTEFRATLLTKAMEVAIVKPRATVLPLAVTSVQIPFVNETTRSTAGTTRGGIAFAYVGETSQKTGSKPSLGLMTLTLHTIYGVCYVTNQLLEDSPITLDALLPQMFGESLAFEEDYMYLWGNGANQPLGVNNAPCLISQTAETGQVATTIIAENIIKMWSRLAPESQARAIWLANPNCFPQLATMSIKVGTAGVPVWLPAPGIAGAPNGTIFGRPLILTEKCQTLGTVGDILLADFSQYYIGQKAGRGVAVDTSIHLRFDYNETAYRIEMRHDGQPAWSSALTPRFGATISPFVALATRS